MRSCAEIINEINKNKLIVIVRGVEKEKLLSLVKAMYDGGVRLLEITYSANGDISDEEVADNIRMLTEAFGDKMCIGAGTVLTEKQVELTYSAGGCFIISPNTSEKVIKRTKELFMVSIPGALTPTEIQMAHNAGADFVKLFPIANFGVEYVKAIKAPLSHIKFLAVGGINENNLKDFLKIGVNGFGIGSNITNKEMIKNNDWLGITELTKKYIDALN